jgi:hypothetical protein
VPIVELVEAEDETTKKSELEKATYQPGILSQPAEAELPKVAKAPTTTPKRRRMASVLDVVAKTTRVLTPAPMKKVVEAVTVMWRPKLGFQCLLKRSLSQLSRRLKKNIQILA